VSYTVYPYLVDLADLRALYGCRDAHLLAALEVEYAANIEEDETPTTALVSRAGGPLTEEVIPPPVPTLRQALRDIIAGAIPPADKGWQYWYALDLLCTHVGQRLPNDQFAGIRSAALDVLLQFDGLDHLALTSRHPFPFPLPPADDFPAVTYLTPTEAATILARLPIVYLVAPFDDADWASWDEQLKRTWQEEELKRMQVQYRQWLDLAVRRDRDMVAFLY
jgi:hypothetical protein